MILKFILFSKIISRRRWFCKCFAKKSKKSLDCVKLLFWSTHIWVNWIGSNFLEFLELFIISIIVESMFPQGTVIAICLMIIFAINTFEEIQTRFVFRGLSWNWLYNTKLYLYDFWFYIAHYILDILLHEFGMQKWYDSTFSNSCTKGLQDLYWFYRS